MVRPLLIVIDVGISKTWLVQQLKYGTHSELMDNGGGRLDGDHISTVDMKINYTESLHYC